MIFEEVVQETVPMISHGDRDRLTVTTYFRCDAAGSTATIFVGDGDYPQLTPAMARQLAHALHRAADAAQNARVA